jgi:hypothetical protein
MKLSDCRETRALWEIFLLSGADPSGYTHNTSTERGREIGFQEWLRWGSPSEIVAAVRQLRKDYDEACAETPLRGQSIRSD